MSGKKRMADRDTLGPLPGFDAYRASISKRIWAAFAVLTALLGFAGVAAVQAHSELANTRLALREAETTAGESGVLLKSALRDKKDLMKEFAAQGTLIAQSARAEELTRSKLVAVASGKETEKERAAKLAAEVETLRERLAKKEVETDRAAKLATEVETLRERLTKANLAKGTATRALKTLRQAKDKADRALKQAKGKSAAAAKAKARVATLQKALKHTRARLQDAVAEMERLRSAARPYRATRSTLEQTIGQVAQ